MQATAAAGGGAGAAARFDRLGTAITLLAAVAALAAPFATLHANRIAIGESRHLAQSLPPRLAALMLAVTAAAALVALLRTPLVLRLAASLAALAALALLIGRTGTWLVPPGASHARVSPGAGFWLLLLAFALMLADCFTRLRLRPATRILALAAAATAVAALLGSGAWSDLSVLREYSARADRFWSLGAQHLVLAFGSLAAAAAAGIPLGIACQRRPALRGPLLGMLNAVQTIPSIALFGLLIAPLGWIAQHVPGAAALGVSGIGAPPAFVALFAYSLLPMVANTVLGIDSVPAAAADAARGMGMTSRQRLWQVELPLAFPVILAAVRIVLVQNIGLATVAALIGGGGFGVFVFQGIGQMAMDLVMLGAIPTVALAFAAAVVLDAAVEASTRSAAP